MIGVVYSIAQARVRRIIIPDDDSQLSLKWHGEGEGFLTYDSKLGSDLAIAQEQVTALLGRPPDDDNCVVLDANGTVLHAIKGDPAIDIHPDGKVIAASEVV